MSDLKDINILDIPDDELDDLDLDSLGLGDTDEELQEDESQEQESKEEPEEESTDDVDEEENEEPGEEGDEDESNDLDEESSTEELEEVQDKNLEEDDKEDKSTKVDNVDETSNIDYKAEYNKLTAPFKANGKDIKVDSVDEAITLMQMGANYHKKMAALKPSLKMVKMLENHNLLDEDKLSFLIDLDKKNPEAVKKLIKDSGLDPLEVDLDKAEYSPKSYKVDDVEFNLDSTLEGIKDSPNYNRTVQVITKDWDSVSQKEVVKNPQIMEVINSHMDNGIYDQIASVVDKERMLNRLTGMSDLEAYKHVGDILHAQGKLGVGNTNQPEANVVKPAIASQSKEEQEQRRSRKKAASKPRKVVSKQPAMDFNPLNLPDDELDKFDPSKF